MTKSKFKPSSFGPLLISLGFVPRAEGGLQLKGDKNRERFVAALNPDGSATVYQMDITGMPLRTEVKDFQDTTEGHQELMAFVSKPDGSVTITLPADQARFITARLIDIQTATMDLSNQLQVWMKSTTLLPEEKKRHAKRLEGAAIGMECLQAVIKQLSDPNACQTPR